MAGLRSTFHDLARFLGDYEAVKRGRVGKRLARRAVGRLTEPRPRSPIPMTGFRTGSHVSDVTRGPCRASWST
jgi:hypothetical protein